MKLDADDLAFSVKPMMWHFMANLVKLPWQLLEELHWKIGPGEMARRANAHFLQTPSTDVRPASYIPKPEDPRRTIILPEAQTQSRARTQSQFQTQSQARKRTHTAAFQDGAYCSSVTKDEMKVKPEDSFLAGCSLQTIPVHSSPNSSWLKEEKVNENAARSQPRTKGNTSEGRAYHQRRSAKYCKTCRGLEEYEKASDDMIRRNRRSDEQSETGEGLVCGNKSPLAISQTLPVHSWTRRTRDGSIEGFWDEG